MTVSRYESIWQQLKKDKKVSIAVPAAGHGRIKKAVIKRKDIDIAYKFLLSEENKKATLEFESKGNILKATLKVTIRSDWL